MRDQPSQDTRGRDSHGAYVSALTAEQTQQLLIHSAASLPFTFRVGTPSDLSIDAFVPIQFPRSTLAPRDDNFTGNHKLVIVLVVVALGAGILLVVFSSKKAKEHERLAKERGAFLRGIQKRENEPSMADVLAAPLPALRGMRM